MANYTGEDSWIYKQSKKDLIAELEIRGLPGTGSLPVLWAWLTKFEREKEDQNETLDQVEENSELFRLSDEESGTVSAVGKRGPETTTGNKSVEVPHEEEPSQERLGNQKSRLRIPETITAL